MQNSEARAEQNTSGSIYAAVPPPSPERRIDVARVLEVAASAIARDKGRLNTLDSYAGPGTYGDRLARAMTQAAGAVRRGGSGETDRDLGLAGEVIDTVAGGQTGRYYRQGFLKAAQALAGKRGLSLSDLPTFLPAFLAGIQENNPAQAGQSTLIDALIPAVAAYTYCKEHGLSDAQAIQSSLGAAAMGRKKTANQTPLWGGKRREGREDPGAAGIELLLGGLIRGLLGGAPVAPLSAPVGLNLSALTGGSGGIGFDILPASFVTGDGTDSTTDLANLLSSPDPGNTDPGGRDMTDYAR